MNVSVDLHNGLPKWPLGVEQHSTSGPPTHTTEGETQDCSTVITSVGDLGDDDFGDRTEDLYKPSGSDMCLPLISYADDVVTSSPIHPSLDRASSTVDEEWMHRYSDSDTSELTDDEGCLRKKLGRKRRPRRRLSGVPRSITTRCKLQDESTLEDDSSLALTMSQMWSVSEQPPHDKLEGNSSKTPSSRSGSSLGSSSTSSWETFSSVLSSESSSDESVLSDKSDSVLEEKTIDTKSLGKHSLRAKKRCEERAKLLRRITYGNRNYRNYLSRQEEMVQAAARLKIESARRRSAMRRASKLSSRSRLIEEVKETPPQVRRLTSLTQYSEFPAVEEEVGPLISSCDEGKEDGAKVTKSKVEIQLVYQPEAPKESWMVALKRMVLFERYHCLPGVVAMLVYCVAHTATYEAISNVHLLLVGDPAHPVFACFVTLVLGLVCMRVSGTVFNWVSDETYEGARFDMHNKIRLKDFDARLTRWVRRHHSVRLVLDIVGVYLCFVAVEILLEGVLMPALCDIRGAIHEELPSFEYPEIATYTKMMLTQKAEYVPPTKDVMDGVFECLEHENCEESGFSSDVVAAVLEVEDSGYLSSRLSRGSYEELYGFEDATLVSSRCALTFHFVNAGVALSILLRLGVGFWQD